MTAPDTRPTKVLIVEDNRVNQHVLKAILKQEGLPVDIAENGQEALDMCEQHDVPYELIIMDVQMPVMNGIDATREIKSNPDYDDTKIVMLTACALDADREESLHAGADAYMVKPLKREELNKFLPTEKAE